jgi:hypothetical protein
MHHASTARNLRLILTGQDLFEIRLLVMACDFTPRLLVVARLFAERLLVVQRTGVFASDDWTRIYAAFLQHLGEVRQSNALWVEVGAASPPP